MTKEMSTIFEIVNSTPKINSFCEIIMIAFLGLNEPLIIFFAKPYYVLPYIFSPFFIIYKSLLLM
jgi:hypothetical protein